MVELTTDEIYGIIGAIIAGVIAAIVKYKGNFLKKEVDDSTNLISEVKHIREIVDEKFNTQTRILDEKFENLDTGMERIEEKMNYVNDNVESKITELNNSVKNVSGKLEKLQDKFFDHVNNTTHS